MQREKGQTGSRRVDYSETGHKEGWIPQEGRNPQEAGGGILEVPELWMGAFEETWGLFYIPVAELGPEGCEVHSSLDR